MKKTKILESYIKSFILKEMINQDDHNFIQKKITELRQNLRSNGLDLENLNFDATVIASLRDFVPLKDQGTKRIKPHSVIDKPRRFDSEELQDFNITGSAGFKMPGLGFNLMEKLSSNERYYRQKIEELIGIYEQIDPVKWDKVIRTMKNALLFKDSVEKAGLKILGAGIYRAAIADPKRDHFVIKVGLSKKGREDCLNEIEFSYGRGVSRLEHSDNFPTIFDSSPTGAWYAIEKVIFFTEETMKNPEVVADLEEQFKNTFMFFDALGLTKYEDKMTTFIYYIQAMFRYDKGEIDKAHDDYIKSIAQTKKDAHVKYFLHNFTSKIADTLAENFIPEKIVFDSLFKKKMAVFLEQCADRFVKHYNLSKKDYDVLLNNITRINKHGFKVTSEEINNMFDQAIVTNIKDTHLGNLGFKKNEKGKWQLIFTDIDSK